MEIPRWSGSVFKSIPFIKPLSALLFMHQKYYLNMLPKIWPYLTLAVPLGINWEVKMSTDEDSDMLLDCVWLVSMHQNTFSIIICAPRIIFIHAPKNLTLPYTSSPSRYKLRSENVYQWRFPHALGVSLARFHKSKHLQYYHLCSKNII